MIFESKEAFAQSFKAKNPDYKNVPDSVLADKLLAKYPQYQDSIQVKTEAPGFLKAGISALDKGLDIIPGIGTVKKGIEKAATVADKIIGNEDQQFEGANVITETIQGVKDIPKAIGEGIEQAQESTARRSAVMNPIAEEKGALGEGAMKIGTGILNTLDYASKVIGGAVSPLVNPTIKETVENLSPEAQEQLNNTVQSLTTKFESLSPEQQEALRGTGLLAEALLGGLATPTVARAGKQAVKVGKQAVKAGQEAIETGIDVARQAPEMIRTRIEPMVTSLGEKVDSTLDRFQNIPTESLPELEAQRKTLTTELSDNFYEALPTDYKRDLLEAKPLVDDYMETFTKSLQSTTAPTIMEKGADKLTNAINTIEGKIKATGNEIGDFREKISTIQVQPVRLDPVLEKFDNNLAKFGLKYENGAIKEVSGRKTKLTPSEIKQLEAMRGDLIDIKESPTAQMIVDVRSKIDSDINFAKDRRDISSNLDGIAKSTRADLAEVNREVIGREQSGLLERYSDLNDLVTEYRKASGKGKNLEFFLKRIMSERGRTPKGIVERIKNETGVDLTQDAIVIDAITSYLAPQRMKGRFQQEIASAGLDAGTIISGIINPVGAVKDIAAKTIVNKMIKKFTDTPLQKTWEKLLKNDEAMLELEKALKETEVKGWSNVDEAMDLPNFNKAESAESALIEEAKKYKTADEFVNSLKIDYHGTNQPFDEFKMIDGQFRKGASSEAGFWFTDNLDEAWQYADVSAKRSIPNALEHEKKVAELMRKEEAAVKAKNWDLAEKLTNELEDLEFGAMRAEPSGQRVVEVFIDYKKPLIVDGSDMTASKQIELAKQAKKDGYDAIVFENIEDSPFNQITTNQTLVLDEKIIKTKSQLKQIWEEANRKQ